MRRLRKGGIVGVTSEFAACADSRGRKFPNLKGGVSAYDAILQRHGLHISNPTHSGPPKGARKWGKIEFLVLSGGKVAGSAIIGWRADPQSKGWLFHGEITQR
jgi:hypothetical protein